MELIGVCDKEALERMALFINGVKGDRALSELDPFFVCLPGVVRVFRGVLDDFFRRSIKVIKQR